MSDDTTVYEIMLVDDDREVLEQLRKLLPADISEKKIEWFFVDNFDNALAILKRRRYDLLVSDIYRGRDKGQKNIANGDARARDLVNEIRARRFCPIVLFTDGQLPDDLAERPFVWTADKSQPNFNEALIGHVTEAIGTGLPEVARSLHDELDRYAGSYLWQFLAERWEKVTKDHGLDPEKLERIIRRRAAVHLARVDASGDDIAAREGVDPADYYIYPPISKFIRLGEIIRRKGTHELRVVLTPHCFLVVQPDKEVPRATHVLTAQTILAADLRVAWKWDNKDVRSADELRRRTSFPAANVGVPEGRYCFLPAFIDIPDIYCDLMQLESLGYKTIEEDFERVAVLDWPFAEALQACMTHLYGSVGVPSLSGESVKHLGPPPKPQVPAGGQSPNAAAAKPKV